MTILAADFSRRLSGGASNAVGNAAIGGIKSSVAMSGAADGLFDPVTAAQAAAGSVEYRCIYLNNNNVTDLMTAARVWVSTNVSVAGRAFAIGVGVAAVNGTETAVADESTAPAGVVFTTPLSAAAGLALGNLPAGQAKSVWLRRTITAGAAVSGDGSPDMPSLGFDCETV